VKRLPIPAARKHATILIINLKASSQAIYSLSLSDKIKLMIESQ
jgi:hypothetical protein